jgi:hypothetical protein
MNPSQPSSPSPEPSRERIQSLHQWYCAAMGTPLPLNMAFERYWFDWLSAGYNGPQLRKVMNYLRRQIAAQKRNEGALKLSNLLNPETFAEDLALAGASFDPEKRLPQLPESERVAREVTKAATEEARPATPPPTNKPDWDALRKSLR